MQENAILNFIGEYINAGLREIFSGGTVEHILLDEETMKGAKRCIDEMLRLG